MKPMLKWALARAGLRTVRTPLNRFDAMDQVLLDLLRRGFRPSLIVDGGAHLGVWAGRARRVFPGPPIVLVEPQPACRKALDAAGRRLAPARVVPTALSAPGTETVFMDAEAYRAGSTGSRVLTSGEPSAGTVRVAARTLDDILDEQFPGAPRAPTLLKLDLEGHEVEALAGARALLARGSVVIAETRLLGRGVAVESDFERLIHAMSESGYVLYDVAALAGRPGDGRLRLLDVVFVQVNGPLDCERRWALA